MNILRLIVRLFLGRRLPTTTGRLTVPGPRGKIRVHRDRWGIPLIDADDPRDGAFALGFCHGQDRAFQLELLLRVTRGQVSELIGPAALPVDRLSRRVGFHRAATQQWPLLDEDIRTSLQDYAAGVQAGVFRGCRRVPHEFAFLSATPTPWSPLDTLALTKLLSFTLMSNYDAELARLKMLTTDGPEALRALDATYPDWQPALSPVGAKAGAAVDRLSEDISNFLAFVGKGGGSNNWAIAPGRTATGRPLLANDPHLDARVPAHWYLARFPTPTGPVAGGTFVGGPLALAGHNGTACWGLTAGLVDNTDLFLEQLGPDGQSVKQGDGHVPCQVLEEVIPIKGREPVVERVLITPRGPIISPALTDTPQALSLRATWLDPLPITGLFRLNHVRTFAEFRAAFTHWPIASQCIAYADTSGTIGWQLIGRVPVRKKGHGLIPLAGWDNAAGWQTDPVPYEQLPYVENPECGFVASANVRPQPEGQGPFLGTDFVDGYRQQALVDALGARRDWDVAAVMRLQLDQRATAWTEMRDAVLSVPTTNAQTQEAQRLLRAWDGIVAADSVAAGVYELFLAEMVQKVAKARAPQSWNWLLGEGVSVLGPHGYGAFRRTGHLVRLLREQPADWFDRPWNQVLDETLASAIQQSGSRPWGELRSLVMSHPLSRAPGAKGRAMATVFNMGPFPCGGDTDVINQASVLPLVPLAPADNIPSMRAVFDVGAWQHSRFVLPGGQSGNPMSPHYRDLLELWRKGEGVPIAFTDEEVRAATVQTLELVPE